MEREYETVRHPIMIWRFEDAPKDLQKLSTNSGDEDWVIYVNQDYKISEEGEPEDLEICTLIEKLTTYDFQKYKYDNPSMPGWVYITDHG